MATTTTNRIKQTLVVILQDEFQILAVLPAICGITTILLCYIITVDVNHHIPAWFSLPEISMLGARNPEHTIYQIGVSLTFITVILFYFSFGFFLKTINGANRYNLSIFLMKLSIITSALGLLFQGLVTLTKEKLHHLRDADFLDSHDTQSFIHRLFAVLFFVSAVIHELVAVVFYFRVLPRHIFSKWLKMWLLIICIVSIVGIVLFREMDPSEFSHRNGRIELISLHYSGIFEWCTLFCILIFFASYSMDYYWINKMQREDEMRRELRLETLEQSQSAGLINRNRVITVN